METVKEYVEKYPERLKAFMDEYMGSEMDFIEMELEYLMKVRYESIADNVKFFLSEEPFNADKLQEYDKKDYLIKGKINFLNQKKTVIPKPQTKQTNLSESPIREKVMEHFGFMLGIDLRKHQKILTDTDFDNLIDWITYYFENDFTLPDVEKPIKSINTAKGNVLYTFVILFVELHPSATRPDSLYELIKRCFHQYRDDKIDNIKKTKKPPFYEQTVKINQ